MKYRDKLIEYFSRIDKGMAVSANKLYEEQFSKMTQSSFFKALERLAKDGIIIRVGKGMYSFANSEFNETEKSIDRKTESDEAVLNYYFGENNDNGMLIGYRLYNKYGISPVKKDSIELYSNTIRKESCNAGNVHVKRICIKLDYENARVVEALEIMQNYYNIEELNKMKFARYARQFARGYNDAAAVYVIENVKYKKSTIAFMKKVLEMYKVDNSLQQFLSYSSNYKIPPVQRVAR